MSKERRIGKFYLADYLIRNQSDSVAQALWEMKFVPLRVEHLWSNRKFLMEGFSPKFSEVKEGMEIPFYEIVINDLQEGEISISVKGDRERIIKGNYIYF